MLDLHVHSLISRDAESGIRDYCEQASKDGVVEIGFAEHLDLCPADPHCGLHDYEKYREEIAACRKDFPALKLRMGVEVSYLPSVRKEIFEYLSGKDYDFILGAVHLVREDITVSESDGCREFFAKGGAEERYREFFGLTLELVESGLFDGLAHLDIINRYALELLPDWDWRPHYGQVRKILEGLIRRGMALEINTSGWRQPAGRPYPDPELVKLYRELGGEMITIGSDAHRAEELGKGVQQALKLAKQAGFWRVASFEGRDPRWVEIKG